MTAMLGEKLKAEGWNISAEGLDVLSDNGNIKDLRIVRENALNTDLKDVGKAALSEMVSNRRVDNIVVQIQKVRNASAPKANEDSQGAPRMLKLIITDGHSHCQAVECESIQSLSLHKTAPGSKLLLRSPKVSLGYIVLSPSSCVYLGGKVQALYEKWELNKNMLNCKRGEYDGEGPPPWVNFGTKIEGSNDREFKSLEVKDKAESSTEFDAQRHNAIAEAANGAVKKVFGGGTKIVKQNPGDSKFANNYDDVPRHSNRNLEGRERNGGRKNNRWETVEKDMLPQKPSEKVSLFAFLEDKLPTSSEISSSATTEPHKINSNYLPKQYQSDSRPNNTRFNGNDKRFESDSRRNFSGNKYNGFNEKHNSGRGPYQNDSRSSARIQQNDTSYYNNTHYLNNQNRKSTENNAQKFEENSEPKRQYPRRNQSSVENVASNMERLNVNAPFASKVFKQHLNLQPSNQHDAGRSRNQEQQNDWQWKVGDQCLAKYWEDDKYYNASVVALTVKTCVVQFNDYGNMEEVLQTHCIPISDNKQEAHLYSSQGNSGTRTNSYRNRQGRR